MNKYYLDFQKVNVWHEKTDTITVEFDVWLNSDTCDGEYIGQYQTIKDAHETVKMMFENGILF